MFFCRREAGALTEYFKIWQIEFLRELIIESAWVLSPVFRRIIFLEHSCHEVETCNSV